MTVTIYDKGNRSLHEVLRQHGVLTPHPVSGNPYRIRVRYDSDVSLRTRKQVTELLREAGFERVGNTSSWKRIQQPLTSSPD